MGSVLTEMWRRLRSMWPWWRWTLSRRNTVDGASQQDVRGDAGPEVIAGADGRRWRCPLTERSTDDQPSRSVRNYVCGPPLAWPSPASRLMPLYRGMV